MASLSEAHLSSCKMFGLFGLFGAGRNGTRFRGGKASTLRVGSMYVYLYMLDERWGETPKPRTQKVNAPWSVGFEETRAPPQQAEPSPES